MFKVGDKIKCVDNDNAPELEKGAVYTVASCDHKFVTVEEYRGGFGGFYIRRFEKIMCDYKFKVGDLVKCVHSSGLCVAGKVYRVSNVKPECGIINIETHGTAGYYTSRFEKYIPKFKFGQRVWSSRYGWGQVVKVDIPNDNPIGVEFFDTGLYKNFTLDGKITSSALRPSLFVNEVPLENWPNPDPVLDPTTLVEDQEIEVKLSEGEGWSKRKFAMIKNNAVWVYSAGKDSKTCKNMFKVTNYREVKNV